MKKAWRSYRGWIITVAVIVGAYSFLHFVVLVPKPINVRVHKIGKGIVERTVTNTKAGSVRSRRDARIAADTSGRVMHILHREGAKVTAGDPLIKLDDRSAESAVETAKKELESAEHLQKQAEHSRDEAVRERDRLLEDPDVISKAELDRAKTQAKVAEAAYEAAQARVASSRQQLAQAELERSKLSIVAPFSGVVAELYIEVGEWAGPGTPLLRLLNLDDLYIRAELDEVDVGRVADLEKKREDIEVRVTLDPYKDRVFEGTVTRIAPYISETLEQNRTVEIEVKLLSAVDGNGLKPGISADVEVILETVSDVVRVPTLAVTEDREGNRKVLVVRGGMAVSVKIEPGVRNWDFTEIKSGIDVGDLVIVSLDREEVKEGAQVQVDKIENEEER